MSTRAAAVATPRKPLGAPNCPQENLKYAVFARKPLPTNYDWRGIFPERASVITDRIEYWVNFAWTSLVTCGLHRLWTQAVASARGEGDDKESADYFTVVYHWTNKLRGALTGVLAEDTETRSLDARILRAIYTGLVTQEEPVPRTASETPGYLLFFDGGSRGNPGPGGSGSVIVRIGDAPEIVRAAAMSYEHHRTTNNLAEYQGLCTGLAAAEHHGWSPMEVIGGSMMIIRQMSTRRCPKAPPLRQLYEKARYSRCAPRTQLAPSKNKMADKAANQAMDSGTSFEARADSGRQGFEELRVWLRNDVQQWLRRRDTPPAPA